jgi:hypothetical protein
MTPNVTVSNEEKENNQFTTVIVYWFPCELINCEHVLFLITFAVSRR